MSTNHGLAYRSTGDQDTALQENIEDTSSTQLYTIAQNFTPIGCNDTEILLSVPGQKKRDSRQYTQAIVIIIIITRGQSNLTKSASRGAHSPVRGHPRGSKVVPLNSWGRVSY